MARSLSRYTKLYVSTLPDITAGPSISDTFELKILDGYSFSQDTANEQVAVDEAGCTVVRGTQSFNTALNPAQVSFSVYARPYIEGASGSTVKCPEAILWNAAFSDTATNAETSSPNSLLFDLDQSNTNDLLTLTLYFKFENTVYRISNFTVDTVEVDFSIDAIATLTFTGQGSRIYEDQAAFDYMTVDPATNWIAGTDYLAVPTTTEDSFLRNKLSTIVLTDSYDNTGEGTAATINEPGWPPATATFNVDENLTADFAGGRVYNTSGGDVPYAQILSNTTGAGTSSITVTNADDLTNWDDGDTLTLYLPTEHAAVAYNIPITGGSLTFSNNMSYLTPEELAIVNVPLKGYPGARSTTGSLTAYLNTGAVGSAGLLDDLLRKITEVSNDYSLTIRMGACNDNDQQVQFAMPHCQIGVPTTNVEDIISTEITFTAQEWDIANDVASFEDKNSLTVKYIHPTLP